MSCIATVRNVMMKTLPYYYYNIIVRIIIQKAPYHVQLQFPYSLILCCITFQLSTTSYTHKIGDHRSNDSLNTTYLHKRTTQSHSGTEWMCWTNNCSYRISDKKRNWSTIVQTQLRYHPLTDKEWVSECGKHISLARDSKFGTPAWKMKMQQEKTRQPSPY